MPTGHAAVSKALDEKRLGGGERPAGERLKGCFEQGGQLGGGGGQGRVFEMATQLLPQVGVAPQAPLDGFFLE